MWESRTFIKRYPDTEAIGENIDVDTVLNLDIDAGYYDVILYKAILLRDDNNSGDQCKIIFDKFNVKGSDQPLITSATDLIDIDYNYTNVYISNNINFKLIDIKTNDIYTTAVDTTLYLHFRLKRIND